MRHDLLLLPAILAAAPGQAEGLDLPAAIRSAWARQPGLLAGEAMAERARQEAAAAAALNLPTLQASAGWLRTDEPMMAFGMKLNQARIQAPDFSPASLNHPSAVTGLGASLSVTQPLYAGGRLQAARKGANLMAGAETAHQLHRRQQVAAAVVQAYFGTQAAQAGVAYAEETVQSAKTMEAFVGARVEQGLLLKSELARTRAWRAQTEAGLAEARRQEAGARSALGLLTGQAAPLALATPLEVPAAGIVPAGRRADLEAARLQAQAAASYAKAAEGTLKPEVGLNLGWGTARPHFSGAGGAWTTAALGARWNFSFADSARIQAARAATRAAEFQTRWQEAQAAREVEDAQQARLAAEAKVKAAEEAVAASEEARRLRKARHLEGLLPLTDLLDAEAALAGARALRLQSIMDARVARAQEALALGTPVEGVTE
jgi:outer membrane protein TolC